MTRRILCFLLFLTQIQLFSQTTTIFKIDSIHSIEQNFDSLGIITTLKHLRKGTACGVSHSYYQNGRLKEAGNWTQVTDTISVAQEELLTGEITFFDEIIDNSPRRDGNWTSFDSIGRIVQLKKYSKSLKPFHIEMYDYENSPYLTIKTDSDRDTVNSIEFNQDGVILRNYESVGDSLCGKYAEFHSNGEYKTKGQYVLIPSEKMVSVSQEDLLTGDITYFEVSEGLIPHKHGVWSDFNKDGELIKTTRFINGKMVK